MKGCRGPRQGRVPRAPDTASPCLQQVIRNHSSADLTRSGPPVGGRGRKVSFDLGRRLSVSSRLQLGASVCHSVLRKPATAVLYLIEPPPDRITGLRCVRRTPHQPVSRPVSNSRLANPQQLRTRRAGRRETQRDQLTHAGRLPVYRHHKRSVTRSEHAPRSSRPCRKAPIPGHAASIVRDPRPRRDRVGW
jgi:hypothetical protein